MLTSGATESLNMAINGLVRPGCHVLSTGVEHNAVARPLQLLAQRGLIQLDFLPCTPAGLLDPQQIARAVRPNTRLLVMSHASNLLGTVQPVAECFRLAKAHGLFTLLDAAQSAGHLPVLLDENTDVIAFAGHKGLGGLAGVGGFVLAKGVERELLPWKAGGTGSHSQSLDMPDFLPDKYEPGTPNSLGILSLRVAVEELLEVGIEPIHQAEQALTRHFLQGLAALPVQVQGSKNAAQSVPVVSVNAPGQDAGLLARRLQQEHGVLTRSGLHCAPLAHQTAGSFPAGSLRFSFGRHTTTDELDYTLAALEAVLGAGAAKA